uniref:Uncharacterized protein n=1 Tax=Arion vulgaris TaxID=1028688 RepID=A0A0B6YT59_9EUPU
MVLTFWLNSPPWQGIRRVGDPFQLTFDVEVAHNQSININLFVTASLSRW